VINLVLLKTFYLKSDADKIMSYEYALQGIGYIDKNLELSVLLIISVSIAYLVAGYWLLRKHLQRVKNHYSTLAGVDLKWLRVLLYCIAVVILLSSVADLVRNHLDIIPPDLSINMIYVIILAGLTYVGFHGIRQTRIFYEDQVDVLGSDSHAVKSGDNQSSMNQITGREFPMEEDYQKLIRYMEKEKPYQDDNLTIALLSRQTGMKPRYLSQLINKNTGKNFFDFVNSFRIMEFKARIRQEQNSKYTLLTIAYDCGFNSKATFNRAFKQHTGHTPSEFLHNPDLN